MDEIKSSEFRKRYTDLTKPTVVYAGKYVIGEWWPHGTIHRTINSPETDRPASIPEGGFNTRPFRPVPKKTK